VELFGQGGRKGTFVTDRSDIKKFTRPHMEDDYEHPGYTLVSPDEFDKWFGLAEGEGRK
jgi:hypothetical protein